MGDARASGGRLLVVDRELSMAQALAATLAGADVPVEARTTAGLFELDPGENTVVLLNTTGTLRSVPELEQHIQNARENLDARVFLITDDADPLTRYVAADGGVSFTELMAAPRAQVAKLLGDTSEYVSRDSLLQAMRSYSSEGSARHFNLRFDLTADHNLYLDAGGDLAGFFVCTPCMLPVGTAVALSVELVWGETLVLTGEVAWVREPRRIGLKTRAGLGVSLAGEDPARLALLRRMTVLRKPMEAPSAP